MPNYQMIQLGTDIVYIPRIQATLDRFGDRFLQRVYTPTEQHDCEYAHARGDRGQNLLPDKIIPTARSLSINYLAGRWAAKEAVAKALGTGFAGVRYTDIEIRRHISGAPSVCLYGAAAAKASAWGECHWQLSLSHDRDYCVATALLVCLPSTTPQ